MPTFVEHPDTLETQLEASIAHVKAKNIRRNILPCKWCQKPAEVISEIPITRKDKSKQVHKVLKCGHVIIEDIIAKLYPDGRDEIWNKLFNYQRAGVEFIEQSNFNCLVADEMGMGKTPQALAALRYNFEALTPCLIVVPAGLIYNWQREYKMWLGDKYNKLEEKPMIHIGGDLGLTDDQKVHIISSALVGKEDVLNSILNYGFKCVIADESHNFKNQNSGRTLALTTIARNVPHRILLSGTPIMNKIGEYFTTLNLIRPEHWPSKSVLYSYCETDSRGKYIAIRDVYRPWFFDRTNKYIIRRLKKDHLKDLPEKQKNFQYVNVAQDKMFVTAYNKHLDELDKVMAAIHGDLDLNRSFMDILALISKLRHITGLAKIRSTVSFVREFMESTDPEQKLTVGCHHVDVRKNLAEILSEYHPIQMSDEPAHVKDAKENEFRKPENRLLIASIIGCGEGRNLQFCTNSLSVEREWNPAKEDQFEGRFHRIGTKEGVINDYLLASNTIDEFFHELVELKRQVVGLTLDKDFSADMHFIKELAERVIQKRLKFVG